MRKRLLPLFVAVLILPPLESGSANGAGLLGWWRLDDDPGSLARDSSGNGRDGTIMGNPARIEGVMGGAMEFHGKGVGGGGGDYIKCNSDAHMSLSGPISIAIWLRPEAVEPEAKGTETAPLAKADSVAGWSWQLRYGWLSPRPFMGFQFNGTDGRVWVYVNQNLTQGEWCHVAGSYDGSTVKCYLNGTETDSQSMSGYSGGPCPLLIGSEGWGCDWIGGIDDVRIYDGPLAAEEIRNAMTGRPGVASDPNPPSGATDVPRDAVLGWRAGKFAQTHDVYFGTVAADVNEATRSDAKGVLADPGQGAVTYDAAGPLAFGQTCYWRVDEVNAPDRPGTYKGDLWSFTSEPYGYAVKPVKATASSSSTPSPGTEKTIDGSGLNGQDQHSTASSAMWLSKTKPAPAWIKYEFDGPCKLQEMWVWNSNQTLEPFMGYGAKDVTVETSLDGTAWTALANVPEFAQARGEPNCVHNTTVDFGGVLAKYVRLTINKAWGGSQAGLSEVRFFHIPLKAFGPQPADGATGVAVDGVMNWRPGREAVRHQVYLGPDPSALALAGTVTAHSLGLASLGLEYGTTYYWRVTEVNDAATPASWEGDVWSLSTRDYLAIDDFERYDNKCNRIFFVWHDGAGHSGSMDCGVPAYGGNGTGSTAGNASAPFAEGTMVRGSGQSMPLFYDNTTGKDSSEAIRTFDAPQDWTQGGVKTLVLYFAGRPDNGPGQLYATINGVKAVFAGDDKALVRGQWRQWNIDPASLATDLRTVRTLGIGVSGSGKGLVYVDDIRLYRSAPPLPQPVEPNTTGLVARYTFDKASGTTVPDVSGNKNHGTLLNDARVENGRLVLDGVDDVMKVPRIGGAGATYGEATYFMWVYSTDVLVGRQYAGGLSTDGWDAGSIHFKLKFGVVNVGINGGVGDVQGIAVVQPNEWSPIAMTVSKTEIAVYLYGHKDASAALAAPLTDLILGGGSVGGWANPDIQRTMAGSVDDVRIYTRALSESEILGLSDNNP